jgi:hypothetical protein
MLHAIENPASSNAKKEIDKLFSVAHALLGFRPDTRFGAGASLTLIWPPC